jgi:EAL domain-containing protein (putative c-di-GMP-specific phosphodiesterase class I)
MEVVAEGVESFVQLDYLREHGADRAQGYLFSPPLPARAFIDLVGAMEPLHEARPARGEVVAFAPRVA